MTTSTPPRVSRAELVNQCVELLLHAHHRNYVERGEAINRYIGVEHAGDLQRCRRRLATCRTFRQIAQDDRLQQVGISEADVYAMMYMRLMELDLSAATWAEMQMFHLEELLIIRNTQHVGVVAAAAVAEEWSRWQLRDYIKMLRKVDALSNYQRAINSLNNAIEFLSRVHEVTTADVLAHAGKPRAMQRFLDGVPELHRFLNGANTANAYVSAGGTVTPEVATFIATSLNRREA